MAGVADGELHVFQVVLVDIESDAVGGELLKSGGLGVDVVGADGQVEEFVGSVGIGASVVYNAGLGVRCSERDVGNDCSAGVCNRTANTRLHLSQASEGSG